MIHSKKVTSSGAHSRAASTSQLCDPHSLSKSRCKPCSPISASVRSSFTSHRSEGFLAPGPAFDHIVSPVSKPKGITKEKLITLAQESNLKRGLDQNAGLELFLPPQTAQSPSLGVKVEVRKEPGFKTLTQQLRRKMRSCNSLAEFASREQLSATPSQLRTALLSPARSVTRQSSPRTSLEQVQAYIRTVTSQVALTAEKLNRRCVLSKEANRIRASTMATVKISAKVRRRQLSQMHSLDFVEEHPVTSTEAVGSLKSSLENRLVDKLAAAEIETIRKIERDIYPKLSSGQLAQKLGRLRASAESHLSPLQSAYRMEVIHMKNRRIR